MATDLTILETADQLNVSEGFVLAEISAGRLGCRVVDGERLVPADELVAYRDALRARQERSLQGLADSTQELGSGEPIEATLARLKAYRDSDPGFKRAIGVFVDAEATLGRDDPAEGRRTG